MISPITQRARELRNNATDAEKKLWRALKESGLNQKFRRQYPVGPYYADFASKNRKLIIEVDGGQHSLQKDEKRTEYLEKQGYIAIRFWNNEILENIEGVMKRIVDTLNAPPLPPRLRGGNQSVGGQ